MVFVRHFYRLPKTLIMKSMINSVNLVFLFILVSFIFSCKKETIQSSTVATGPAVTALTGSDSILRAINAVPVIGNYSTRGSQTIYDGQANPDGSNIKLILDFFIQKKILPSPDKGHLTCPVGYGKYMERGWKYVIGYDFKNKQLTLAPNEAMAAQIVPGSFETLYAVYDASSKSFVFQTRFTALEDNGNESEMIEPLVKSE